MTESFSLLALQDRMDPAYGAATPERVRESAAVLSELAQLTSGDDPSAPSRALHVRLALYEHGAFLNIQLYGFSVLPVLMGTRPTREVPLVAQPPVEAHVLASPRVSTPEWPFSYAIVANHPPAAQLEHTLSTLASLLARQEFSRSVLDSGDVREIDEAAARLDRETNIGVKDLLRAHGWRGAATAIRARATAAGTPLHVRYQPYLFSPEQIALRVPVLRRVYNEMPAVRSAVDKTVAMLTMGMTMEGGGTKEVTAFAKDLLDVGQSRRYMAHAARDAFVCGNGYLSFGRVPDEDIRVLRPEFVTVLEPGVVEYREGSRREIHRDVLHLKGAEQAESLHGVSVLEPFVNIQQSNELMRGLIETADAWNRPEVAREHREDVQSRVPVAERTLAANELRAQNTLGAPPRLKIVPPGDLYFDGYERSSPDAQAILMVDSIDD